jgi:hypothetical protein
MEEHTAFAEVLEAADALSIDEQETLVEILRRRVTTVKDRIRRTALQADSICASAARWTRN